MFLLSEEEFFDQLFNEGQGAYMFGSMVGIYKNTLDNIDPEEVKDKTIDIDEKMKDNGFKPLNNPSQEQMKYLIWGKNSKKKGEKATKATIPNPLALESIKYGFHSFNGRKYLFIKASSIFDSGNNKGNIGAIYPLYINDKGKIRNGVIWITNSMLKD